MITLQFLETLLSKFGLGDAQDVIEETYNLAYEGMTFKLLDQQFRSRLAKKTPKKAGYFVVFWTKDAHGKNIPLSDDADKTIVWIVDQEHIGHFVFPKALLREQGILKTSDHKGKMAFRVYPPWVLQLNAQAQKTQQWQKDYFLDLSQNITYEDFMRYYTK